MELHSKNENHATGVSRSHKVSRSKFIQRLGSSREAPQAYLDIQGIETCDEACDGTCECETIEGRETSNA